MTGTITHLPDQPATDETLAVAAAEVVRTAGRASTKLLQSELGIGYGRATRVLELLEAAGVVGPSDGHVAREVLPANGGPIPAGATVIGDSSPPAFIAPTQTVVESFTVLDAGTVRIDQARTVPRTGSAVVDPRALLVDVNIRETRVDPEFVGSIRDLGVLVPIVVVPTDDGPLRVRYGHRRVRAAVEAGLAQVPVYVTDDQGADDADRIVRQWAENEHRAGLTNAERTAAIEQLSLLGIPAGEISKRTHTARADVDHALRVAGSKVARNAVTVNRDLTLEQAAGLAEFEDDQETVDKLLGQLDGDDGAGGFAHELQYQQDLRADRAADDAKRAELIAAGVTVLDTYPEHNPATKARRLDTLADQDGNPFVTWVYDPDTSHNRRDVTKHEPCDGHSAWVSNGGDVSWFCLDWKGYGHRDRHAPRASSSGSVSTTSDDRKEVLERNKQWRSATKQRREFLADFLRARTAPKGTAVYLATELAARDLAAGLTNAKAVTLTYELLELERGPLTRNDLQIDAENSSDARAQVVALAIVIACAESRADEHSWRNVWPQTRRYLEFLAANGYTLSDVEKLAAGQKLGRKAKKAAES